MWRSLLALACVVLGGIWAHAGHSSNRKRPLGWSIVPSSSYLVSDTRPADLVCAAKNARDLALICNRSRLIPRTTRQGGTRTLKRIWKIRATDLIDRKKREFRCRCKAWGRGRKAILTNITVISFSYIKKTFGENNNSRIRNINASELLKCRPPRGFPKPSVFWLKDGVPLGKTELEAFHMRLTKKKNNLLIKKLKDQHTGKYQCVARNFAGTRSGPVISLIVQEPTVNYERNFMNSDCDRNNRSYVNNCTVPSQFAAFLFVATEKGIEEFSWDTSQTPFAFKERKVYDGSAVDIAVSSHDNAIYWTDGKLIQRKSLSRNAFFQPKALFLSHSSWLGGVAVDWVGKKLYWTDKNLNRIVATNQQSDERLVVVIDGLSKPRAIAVDPIHGFMYWTEWGGESTRIARAGMDGGGVESVITDNLRHPNGLAIDYATQRLYWTDSHHGTVQTSSLNGSDRFTIVNGTGRFEPYGIAVWNGSVFWSDRKTNAVYSVTKRGELSDFVRGIEKPWGLTALYFGCQPTGTSPCEKTKSGCSYFCLLSPEKKKFKCTCKTDMILSEDGRTCKSKDKQDSSKPTLNHAGSSANTVLIYILIGIIALLTIWLISTQLKNNRQMHQLRSWLRIRQRYGDPENSEISTAAEPTDITTVTAATDTYHTASYQGNSAARNQGNSTVSNCHGNQAEGECRGESTASPEESGLLQDTDDTKEQASSSETQKLTLITIKQYAKYATHLKQYGGVASIGDGNKVYCPGAEQDKTEGSDQQVSEDDSQEWADEAV